MAKMSRYDRIEAQIRAVVGTQVIALETGDALALVRDGVEIGQALKRGPFWAVSSIDRTRHIPAKLVGLAPTEAVARQTLRTIAEA